MDGERMNPICPYCPEGVEMTLRLTEYSDGTIAAAYYECPVCEADSPYIEYHIADDIRAAAYEAAMKRYVEPNRILSAEDLALMEGEPVFVQQGDGDEFWAMIEDGKPIIGECDRDFQNMTMSPPLHDPAGHFGLHVLGWRALKLRPTDAERRAEKWEEQP